MYEDAEKAAQALYGYNFITIQVEPSWPVAEDCGAGITYPPDKNPWITDYLIKSEADLDKLRVPDFMATRSTRVIVRSYCSFVIPAAGRLKPFRLPGVMCSSMKVKRKCGGKVKKSDPFTSNL